ncbi:hypothetical protein TSUD_352360 [Trifolium subterraneum]|nr:hypothetical protein TSUD_352360 [Trifolium subterraneum]
MFEAKKWEKSLHFTDLIRCSYLPRKLSYQYNDSQKQCLMLKNATKLNEAGISFEKVHNRSLLDIKFEKKPFLSWFLYLGTYICNYISLIDSLIHTKDDAKLLVEKEVIVHELGSHGELTSLVNSLCKYVVTNSTCYYQLMEDLNKHCNSEWKRAMGTLRWVYFRDPWRSSSTIVGIAVLIFTIFNFRRVIDLMF